MIYEIIAIILMIVFYGAYFVKNTYLLRQNIDVYQLGRGKKKRALAVKEIILKYMTALVAIVQVFSLYYHSSRWSAIGLLIAGLGVVVYITALLTIKDNWRVGISAREKTKLITTGIYKFSRNPAFTGLYLVYAGLLVAFPCWIHFSVVILAIVSIHLQVLEEEKHLARLFGKEYQEYKGKTRRYI